MFLCCKFFWNSNISFIFILNQIRIRVEKDPELGFSISGGVGGRGNPFRPDDDVSFVYMFLNNHKVSLFQHFLYVIEKSSRYLGKSSSFCIV
jgi:hypothetical protein